MREPLIAVTAGSFTWRLRADFARQLGPDGIRLEEWLRTGQAVIVKQGPHRIVYRVELPNVTFYVKRNLTPDRVTWVRHDLADGLPDGEWDLVVAAYLHSPVELQRRTSSHLSAFWLIFLLRS